ncbi:glycosyltransferase [Microbacter sp. GSS18]|nr:glycosyltransferase [Microbacter sp. GSS18]
MRHGPRLQIFPSWRDNPYLVMLGLAPRAAGYEVLPSVSYNDLTGTMRRLGAGDILHIHWTSPILQNAPTRNRAKRRLSRLAPQLRRLRSRGVSLIWTIHNRLPHELRYRDEEIALYRLLAECADRVHIMAPSTPELLADTCVLPPERTVIIPHPSYSGIYDTGITRAEARESFDLNDGDRAVLFLGQIRPYKGVGSLVEAVDRAGRDRDDLVLMLGGVAKEGSEKGIGELVPASVRARTLFDFIPDADIARWYTAADLTVLPYRAVLNSGSVHLAATFRLPVVVPDEPHLRAQFGGEPWVAFFDPERPAESIAELLSDDDLFADVGPESFEPFLGDISPWRVSLAYSALLAELSAQATQ